MLIIALLSAALWYVGRLIRLFAIDKGDRVVGLTLEFIGAVSLLAIFVIMVGGYD